jgi:hypothetical protein
MEDTLIQPAQIPAGVTYEASGRSAEINELAKALSKAQGVMKSAPKNKTNPHLKSKYADLASILDAVRAPLSDNGLAVCQVVECDGARIICYTDLLHTSGQWVRGRLCLHAAQTAIQQIGAGITYAKRYALSAILGIASDEEDDGEGEQAKATKPAEGSKYKQISVSDPVPVDPKTAAKNERKKPETQAELVAEAEKVFDTSAKASEDVKGALWERCRKMWPTGTKDAAEAAMTASKEKPLEWKTATVADCARLSKVLAELEANTGEGAPM